MPKLRDTRKHAARELLGLLQAGPHFSGRPNTVTTSEASAQFKIWSDSWVMPLVRRLVPELKEQE